MQLSDIDTDRFFSALMKVGRLLSNKAMAKELLDGAREDTPVINGILREAAMLAVSDENGSNRLAMLVAEQHLAVMLALRELERQQARRHAINRN